MKNLSELSRKLLYPKDRREYSEAFVEQYSQEPWKSKLIEDFGIKYYTEVMRIYQQRLDKNDFNIGPQSVDEWAELRNQFLK